MKDNTHHKKIAVFIRAGASSTQYYFECEKNLCETYSPEMAGTSPERPWRFYATLIKHMLYALKRRRNGLG